MERLLAVLLVVVFALMAAGVFGDGAWRIAGVVVLALAAAMPRRES